MVGYHRHVKRKTMVEFVETPTYRKKNNLKVVTITLVIIGLIALVIFLFSMRATPPVKIEAGISKESITLGEGLYFYDSTHFAKDWRWDFGDVVETRSAGMHWYKKPGA